MPRPRRGASRGRGYLLPAFAPEAAASTAASAIRLRTCLVYAQRAAIQVRAVDGGDSFLTLAIVCHLHEAEATRLSRVAIGNDVHTANSAVGLKQRTDRFFRSPKAEVSNVYILHFSISFTDLRSGKFGGWTNVAEKTLERPALNWQEHQTIFIVPRARRLCGHRAVAAR